MAHHKFVKADLKNGPITIFGDGQQIRSNTCVGNEVNGTIRAMVYGGVLSTTSEVVSR